tara:strand:- start:560 stop:1114 length:555 start_codon:yes stop_codon:yes gene_type:complete
MEKTKKPIITSEEEPTVPPKLIYRYNDMIRSLKDEYKPTGNFEISDKDSGVYIQDKDYPSVKYFSFHYSKEEDGKVKPHRIHFKNKPCSNNCRKKKPIIDLKIIQDGDSILLIAKEPLREKCKKCLEESSINMEIQNLNAFFAKYIREKKIVLRDTTPIPLNFDSKYHEYKLKYLILKNIMYNN